MFMRIVHLLTDIGSVPRVGGARWIARDVAADQVEYELCTTLGLGFALDDAHDRVLGKAEIAAN
jgi:hypothetical protein